MAARIGASVEGRQDMHYRISWISRIASEMHSRSVKRPLGMADDDGRRL